MFDISSLQYNAENPNLITVLYTICSAIGLGILIAITYVNTTHSVGRHNHFVQALILVTIVAATIIQAIGDSVARGLGMLGALSIIRFRTTVRDPRNIVFIFSAIAAGIACGVFGFLIAFVGTGAFCATAFLLKLISPRSREMLAGTVDLQVPQDGPIGIDELEKVLSKMTYSYRMARHRVLIKGKKSNIDQYRFSYVLEGSESIHTLEAALSALDQVTVTNIVVDNDRRIEL